MPQTAPLNRTTPSAESPRQFSAIAEVMVLFALISLLAAEPVPGVNEPHYLPKAKHFIDPSFAAGDLFLQSHDSHWLSAGLAGGLATFLPLTAVAWVGRVLSWLFLAWAWCRLRRSLELPAVLGGLALASWYLATDRGHWAGEWAVGGFEGKSIAYPCIIMAFSELFRGKWPRVWLWLGAAVAWHPLAGGWAGLSFGIAWLMTPQLKVRAMNEAKWLLAATAIGLIGVLPAATGLSGPNQVGNLVASQVHVFLRLAHHQLPRTFDQQRHLAALVSLSLLIAATVWHRWKIRAAESNQDQVARNDVSHISWLLSIAWIAVAFSIVGLIIDLTLTRTRPLLASQLLRFYWFRWSDIAVPLAWTLTFWVYAKNGWIALSEPNALASGKPNALASGREPNALTSGEPHALAPGEPHALASGKPGRAPNALNKPARTWSALPVALGIGITLALIAQQTWLHYQRQHPAADDILLKAPQNREIETDRYVDWLAACEWIRANTPEDSVWFTPEYQQTFKWYAQRAEVVCWKDVPQDNTSVREWYQRVVDCRAPRQLNGTPQEWTSARLSELSQKYGFRWILVDRRIQVQPLLDFEIMYPIETSNRSFAIFRIP